MSNQPSLIFVPGMWHGPSMWEKLVPFLKAQDYKCVFVALPSTTSNSSTGFIEDMSTVCGSIKDETTQGNNVVLVAHAYGAQVAQSAMKDFTHIKDGVECTTASGHVIGLVMIAASFTMTGIGYIEGLGGVPPPTWRLDTDSGFALLKVDPRSLFYHDLSSAEANDWASRLQRQSVKPLLGGNEYAYAGWRDVPVWYLATSEDRVFPVQIQRVFVEMAQMEGANVIMKEIKSSHMPMLSHSNIVAGLIMAAAQAFLA